MEPKTKEQISQEVAIKLAELQKMEETEDLLKKNVNEFLVGKELYRVHKPNAGEKDEIQNQRRKKYVEFLNDSSYLFREQLGVLLKKKGVDIAFMESEALRLHAIEKETLKKLALASIKQDVDLLKAQVVSIRQQAQDLFFAKEEKLRYCIEKQLEDSVRFYVLYLVLEVKNGEAWERKYKSFEDFQKADDDILLGRAAQVLSYLVYNEGL